MTSSQTERKTTVLLFYNIPAHFLKVNQAVRSQLVEIYKQWSGFNRNSSLYEFGRLVIAVISARREKIEMEAEAMEGKVRRMIHPEGAGEKEEGDTKEKDKPSLLWEHTCAQTSGCTANPTLCAITRRVQS
jgi:hypothetical protein